jgi:hypothetical protein
MMKMAQYPAEPSDDDRSYVLWVMTVHDLLRAAADRFWNKVPEAIRSAFFDDDNIASFATTFIPGLRDAKPPDLHTAGNRVGLSNAELARLGEIWGAARKTPAWTGALGASREVRGSRKLYRRVVSRKTELRDHIWMPQLGPMKLGDYARWVRETVRETAGSDHPAEHRLRAYNQLIQVTLASVLGLLEQDPPKPPITTLKGRVAVSQFSRVFGIRLMVEDGRFLHPGEPFTILADGPLDGIYQCTAFSIQLGGQRSIVDIQGRRLSDLEH